MKTKRVLIACESSRTVRDAFAAKGFDAWSNDLLPSAGKHFQCDVFEVLNLDWDLVIAHPPCTDLSVSGAAHFAAKIADGRQRAAIEFFMKFTRCNAKHWAIENPVGIMSSHYRKPDQIIQPYEFGEDASKKTCLWLKNLPLLRSTSFLPGRIVNGKMRWSNQTDSGQNNLPPSDDRWQLRSKTYQGIADAMADQWGRAISNPVFHQQLALAL